MDRSAGPGAGIHPESKHFGRAFACSYGFARRIRRRERGCGSGDRDSRNLKHVLLLFRNAGLTGR